MRFARDRILPAMVALAAMFGGARAARAGSITAVTAPPTAVVGHPVTITIQGRGPCSTIAVNYNTAGTTITTYAAPSFPFSPPPHTYAAAGMKTILVTATGNCTGRATTTITVAAPPPPTPSTSFTVSTSLSALCARIGCGASPSAFARPTLNEVAPQTVQPGQMLMISGSFLGASPGVVRIRLPEPPVRLGVPRLAEPSFHVASWTPFAVTGTLEEGISGFPDGDAQIVVQRSDNVFSNAVAIQFVAAREVVAVPRSYVTVSACGDDAVSRNCLASNDIQGTRYDFATFGAAAEPLLPADSSASFSGFHQNYWDDGGCAGMDQYDIRLPDGWIIDSFFPGVRSTVNATFRSTAPFAGRRVGSVIVDWGLTGGDAHIFYGGWFFADGPRGLSLTR
ncbi:MAG TPA: hypothetical protein VFS34_04110 [Thermoanaerobaculia bacterium]|nr:hypothetical protein [Thermoanaerobaculia bacterium]